MKTYISKIQWYNLSCPVNYDVNIDFSNSVFYKKKQTITSVVILSDSVKEVAQLC